MNMFVFSGPRPGLESVPPLISNAESASSEEMYRVAAYIGADALLGANGEPADLTLICNDNNEPLAVHIKDFYDTDVANWQDIPELQNNPELARAHSLFPMVGTRVLPPNVRRLMDIVVQASADNPDVLATRITEYDTGRGVGDTARHIDIIDEIRRRRELFGLNVHLTTSGVTDVELGRLSFVNTEKFHLLRLQGNKDEQRELVKPLAELTLSLGDVLIFRGGADEERGLQATAHKFTRRPGEQRVREIFTPSYDEAVLVNQQKDTLQTHYWPIA